MYKVINTMYVWRHRRLRSPRYSSGRRRLQAFQSMSLSATFVYSRTFLLFAAPRCCSASCIVSMLIIRLPEAMPGCTLVGERWNKAAKKLRTPLSWIRFTSKTQRGLSSVILLFSWPLCSYLTRSYALYVQNNICLN